jgi:hypothetical protein
MKNIYYLLLLITFPVFSQITGNVTLFNGEPIAFASIYVHGTYNGTTTNEQGRYLLTPQNNGELTIVFQSIGYKTVKRKVQYTGIPITLNILLEQETTELAKVVIDQTEDPAYRVIRAAIKNRKIQKEKAANYTASFYSRGLWRLKDVPEKFLGEEIGDLGGSIDSVTRSGVIYLSETFSEIAYQAPDQFKEHIIASKVSGDDNGFSVNSAEAANFDFYNNTVDLNNQIVSPIADYAFNYYKYQLIGTFFDENNFLINKIKVISKRPNDSTFEGVIYIVEDQWSIYGLDLKTLGSNVNLPFIEYLNFQQNFSYEQSSREWIKRSQIIDFAFGLFGFQGNGRFMANYSDYNFNPSFTKNDFNAQVLSFEVDANKKDSTFWNNRRPVPLTSEELKDYFKKDSIATIRNDPAYKDSIDRVNNKFGWLDPILGYTYRNSNKNYSITYKGLTNIKGFNTVQGFVLGSGLFYNKGFDDNYNKRLYANFDIDYGFSDERFRYSGILSYRHNRLSRRTISLYGGHITQQINNTNAITRRENGISSLLWERNFAKFYQSTYAGIGYSEELFNGFFLGANFKYEDRQPLQNTTEQTYINSDRRDYTPNNPLILDLDRAIATDAHSIFKTSVSITIRPGQKYQSYPDQKFNIPSSKYPSITFSYQGGYGATQDRYNFHELSTTINQSIDLGSKGESRIWINAGTFIGAEDISFIDYKHFRGNRLRYRLESPRLSSFKMMDYFNYSTNSDYTQIHYNHDFKGYVLGKIPYVNRLNFDLSVGAKALFTERLPYFEVHTGIDNIGIGKIRPLRIDYAYSITSGRSFGAVIVGLDWGF